MLVQRLRATYNEFPSRFWVLVGASFIDGVGRTVLFPFFALYVTQRFGVGMTEAGILFGIFSLFGFLGNIVGGGLTDRFGRRLIIIFGLVVSALSSIAMGLADTLAALYPLAAFVGLLSETADPARGAMVADMLPERQRAEGFGLLRVSGNLAWVVGPTVGGLLANWSYLYLFILDAILSLITAAIFYRLIPETMPPRSQGDAGEPVSRTFGGYLRVLGDGPYVAFLITAIAMSLVYIQLYSTLSVYLRDVHGISPQGYGVLMSLNASLVVVAQIAVTRQTKGRPPMLMMALGTTLYMVGFTMYGLVDTYLWFGVAMLIITSGEMIVIPVSQALVARLAPEDMRGRYMAVFALSWAIPSAVGPWAAGLILDHLNPHLVWYLGGALSALAVAGFLALHTRIGDRVARAPMEIEPATVA